MRGSTLGGVDSLYIDFKKDIAIQLLPFNDLFELALSHSPLLNFEKEVSNAQQAMYKLSKLQSLQWVTAGGSYSTGNQAIISTGAGTTGDAIGQIANGYRFGLNLQLSLYDVVGRKHLLTQAKANYLASLSRKEILEVQLKRELIDLYQDLVTAQKVLQLRLKDQQTATVAYQVAEVEFKQRKMNVNDYSGAGKNYYGVLSSVEEARGSFLKFLYNLEALVGVPIQSLKRK
ncbi:TolC family protein [Runella slithyformis]|nr:TolC family protein [Runella slithyformis]